MTLPQQTPYLNLKKLFVLARKSGGINYVYALLRMKGITNETDPFILAKREQYSPLRSSFPEEFSREVGDLIANLFFCAQGKPFSPFPFHHLYKPGFPHAQKPSLKEITQELEKPGFMPIIPELQNVLQDLKQSNVLTADAPASQEGRKFIDALLRIYFAERKSYLNEQILHQLPQFTVLEILLDQTYGLCGFKMHFSTGAHALYERNERSTTSMNIMTDTPIGFFIGDTSKLKNEWMVGEKKLYEIGLPGRYNVIGEWRPIEVAGGSPDDLARRCHEIAGDDDEVEGALFYIVCTGHRCIEFVAKTPIELPMKGIKIGDKMHLWKCDPLEGNSHANSDYIIYDGYYQLDDIDPISIRSAIASINVGLNRLAFAYDSSVDWRLKYRAAIKHPPSQPTPTKEDLDIFNSLLVDFPSSEDAIQLDIAIDWYHRGELAKLKNPFVAFLCYYIAIETMANSISNGDADLGLNFQKESREEKRKSITEEIRKKHDEEYERDPLKFIQNNYFEYFGLKRATRKIAELVFGKDHKYIKALFVNEDDKECLCNLRGKLAHGGITLLSRSDRKLVEERIDEMADISKEFLKRIIFQLKPDQILPRWSQKYKFSIFPSDPRDTKVMGGWQSSSDWRIKPEWLD